MSEYSRQYTSGVSWENLSSTATPLSAGNLNQMDNAILRIDSEAFSAINSKANQTTVNGCINSITFNSTTGIFTISFVNGTTTTINTVLEKVIINFTYDSETQSLVLTLEDGSTQEISLEEFITEYEFEDSDTIGFSVEDGVVTAEIVGGSIGPDQMDPDYLADCEEQVDTAKDYARQSQSYALGNAVDDEGDPYRSGQSTDNAKYYCQQAQQAATEAGAAPFIGATSTTGGVKGLVPAPLIADREKFLKGSGGWAEVNLDPFTGATSSAAGTKGMVPQPSAGDANKFLQGGGSWKELSYVGMIIHSTTLDTESKVKAFYGGTTWIRHDGYMLRGATSGVVANNATATGGADNVIPSGSISGGAVQSHTLTVNEIPSHDHGYKDMTVTITNPPITGSGYNGANSTLNLYNKDSSRTTDKKGGGQGHSHEFTQPSFTGNSHTNLPAYKSVYIWERTA